MKFDAEDKDIYNMLNQNFILLERFPLIKYSYSQKVEIAFYFYI